MCCLCLILTSCSQFTHLSQYSDWSWYLASESSTKDSFTSKPERRARKHGSHDCHTNQLLDTHQHTPGLRYMRVATSIDVFLK